MPTINISQTDLPGHSVIWRYTDLSKLLDVVVNNRLYFRNITKFEDKYEGYIPPLDPNKVKENMIKASISNPNVNEEFIKTLTDDYVKYENIRRAYNQNARSKVFASCWHLGNYESAAMWKLYLSASEGIAIRTTVARFSNSIDKAIEPIIIGKVKYMEYEATGNASNLILAMVTKRLSFQHENELRAFFIGDFNSPDVDGRYINVDVGELIEQVYVAPTCNSWIKDLLGSILVKYGLKNVIVKHSDLYKDPVW